MLDKTLYSDLEYMGKKLEFLKKIRGETILISGATGLIGSQIVKAILHCNKQNQTNINVIALVRNVDKSEDVYKNYRNNKFLHIKTRDVLDEIDIDDKIDYIIHGASITSSRYFVEYPIETIDVAINGTKNMLNLAKEKKVKGFVYLSSLEVYGDLGTGLNIIGEKSYGYIDFTDIRSSYSEGKRMAECLCFAYGKQDSIPIKIARLTQTFGAGVDYNDNRVFAQFARSVIEKKDIILHTEGETVRNYCYTADAVLGILTILVLGKSMEAYNIANENTTISIKSMATMLVNKYKDRGIKLRLELGEEIDRGYNPVVKVQLDSRKLQALGWKTKFDLEEMYERLITSMKYRKEDR